MKIINTIKDIFKIHKSICMKLLALIIVIITVLVITSVLRGSKGINKYANSNNAGIAVQDGSWIYFSKVEDGGVAGIYKVKQNSKNATKVIEGNLYCLNLVDNYIYCLEEDDDDGQNNLVKIKKNGKDKEILAENIDEAPINVADNWIYYLKNGKLCRIKTNGKDKETVSDKKITYYQIDGKLIYYIYGNDNSKYIAKMKLNGENSEKIVKANSGEDFEALYVKGGTIYYIQTELNKKYDSEYNLYKTNKKGDKTEKVCNLDENIKYINMQEDRIYYTVTEDYDEYELKSIKYNGKDKKTIKTFDGYVGEINVLDKWIVVVTVDSDYEQFTMMINKNGNKEKSFE